MYQHAPMVKQAENERAYGLEFGKPEAVRSAEKRIAAAKAANTQEKAAKEPEGE